MIGLWNLFKISSFHLMEIQHFFFCSTDFSFFKFLIKNSVNYIKKLAHFDVLWMQNFSTNFDFLSIYMKSKFSPN